MLPRTFLILALKGQGLGNSSVLGQLISGDWSPGPPPSLGQMAAAIGKEGTGRKRRVQLEIEAQNKDGHFSPWPSREGKRAPRKVVYKC